MQGLSLPVDTIAPATLFSLSFIYAPTHLTKIRPYRKYILVVQIELWQV